MPHACRAMKTDANVLSRIMAAVRRQTHVCEERGDTTTYCGLTVAQVDESPVSVSVPARFGRVHADCEREFRRRHP